MTQIVPVNTIRGEARVSSRDLAEALANKHENVMSLLADYGADFESFGILRFETEKIGGRGRPAQYAFLNEDQCYFLLTLVRNNEVTVALKRQLVQAFGEYRRRDAAPAPALPTDPVELLALSLQGLQQHKRQLDALEKRLDDTPIRMYPQMESRVKLLCQAFGRVHPKSFAGAYHAFKEALGFQGVPLARYDSLPAHRYQEACEWLNIQIKTFSAQRPLLDEVGG